MERLCQQYAARAEPFQAGPATHFRYRSRLAVRGRVGHAKLGLFQRGSHRVVDVPECPIHHPGINSVAQALKRTMKVQGLAPYVDDNHSGVVRYLQVAIEPGSERAQVVVVCNTEDPTKTRDLCAELLVRLEGKLHSLWLNGNTAMTNRILGSSWHHVFGEDALCEPRGHYGLFYPPNAFGQSHWQLACKLGREIAARLGGARRIAEFYAGVGAIGLGLVSLEREVAFNELAPGSVQGLERGIASLPPTLRCRTRLHAGPAASALHLLDDADAVIVDPPRKGLDPTLLEALCQSRVEQLAYASCDLQSFERDCAALVASGAFQLQRLGGWDFFPYTERLETLAFFGRT